MEYEVKHDGRYEYIDEGEGPVMLLLHGLFGALSNWESVINHFKSRFRVIIPLMPIYEGRRDEKGVMGLVKFVESFVADHNLTDLVLLGNSLGGHVALIYTLQNQSNVKSLLLTGSSGLFENTMGGSFPKRGDLNYIRERVAYTFYDPNVATDELIEEVFEITKSISKCMRIVQYAKSAQRHNLALELPSITIPTLLIWGLNDTITPPMVGHEFNRLIPDSELFFVDKCCHAPMMEQPQVFNQIVDKFIKKRKLI